MKIKYTTVLWGLIYVLLDALSSIASASSESALASIKRWQLEKQENGISVYSQQKVSSEFLQIKIEMNLPATVSIVASHFGDGSECMRWQKRCLSSSVVKTINANEKLVYTTLDMPWPLTTRDFIFHSLHEKDPITNTYILALRPSSEVEIQSTLVRAESNIVYKLEAIDAVSSKLTMLIHTDLGGDIPPSFVNSRLANELYEDTLLLRTLVSE